MEDSVTGLEEDVLQDFMKWQWSKWYCLTVGARAVELDVATSLSTWSFSRITL